MFVPNFPTFRQVTLCLFLLFSFEVIGAQSLYEELNFLEQASKKIEVYLPGENKKQPKKKLISEFSDSISTGQAGIQKKEVKSGTYNSNPGKKKRLRFRSR